MSFIPGDEYHQDEPFFTEDECRCEICGEVCELEGDANYCDSCEAQVDREESEAETVRDLPVLRPIPERPVELNAKLWSEWKRLAEKL